MMRTDQEKLSLEAIGYQTKQLNKALLEYTPDDYPDEACVIACWFFCVSRHVENEIWELRKKDNLTASEETRVRDLAEIIRKLFSYTRSLKTSHPSDTPPEIHLSIQELLEFCFPDKPRPIALIGPQWDYNLTYDPLSLSLYGLFSLSKLDPNGQLGANNTKELINKIWKKYKKEFDNNLEKLRLRPKRHKLKKRPPDQTAILTFAGLDTEDALMYPLLAHEIGHFIDFCEDPSLSSTIYQKVFITLDAIRAKTNDDIKIEDLENKWQLINNWILTGLRETFADLIGVRLMGLSFFVAMAEFLNSTAQWTNSVLTKSGYPGIAFRLKSVLDEFLKIENGYDLKHILSSGSTKYQKWLFKYISDWEEALKGAQEKWNNHEYFDSEFRDGDNSLEKEILEIGVEAFLVGKKELEKLAADKVSLDKKAKINEGIFERIKLLERELPPFLNKDYGNHFSEILSSAWIYQRKIGDDNEKDKEPEKAYEEYQKTCRLVFKAIELIQVKKIKTFEMGLSDNVDPAASENLKEAKGALNDSHILGRMQLPCDDEMAISVVPKISKNNGSENLGEASLDVQLGNWFAYAKKSKTSQIDLRDKNARKLFGRKGRNQVYVPFNDSFIIHPGDFVLGTTLEFFRFPNDLMAFVEGKSSIGRLGLFIATATQVGPEFKGVIVLELANAGTVPLSLKPGMPIAQLVFQTLTGTAQYKGGYSCQTKPIQG